MREKIRKIMVMGLMVLAVTFLAEVAIAADEAVATDDNDSQFESADEQGYGPGGPRGRIGRGGRFDRGIGGPGMGGRSRGERRGGGGNPVRMLLARAEHFELTENQITSLEEIEDVETRPDRELMGELHEEMQAAVIAADVEEVEEIADRISALITETAIAKAEVFAEIKSILTVEQYEQLQDTIQQMQERREQRREMMRERFENRRGRGRGGYDQFDGYDRRPQRRGSRGGRNWGQQGGGQQQW